MTTTGQPSWGLNNIDKTARATIHRAGVPEYAKPFHSLRKTLEYEWLAEHPVITVTKVAGALASNCRQALSHAHTR